MEIPQNLTVVNVTGSRSAILSWDPVSPESVKGHFKGYKVNFIVLNNITYIILKLLFVTVTILDRERW